MPSRVPAIDYISTDSGVDSSSRFPFISRTDTPTDKRVDATDRSTHAGLGYRAGVGDELGDIR